MTITARLESLFAQRRQAIAQRQAGVIDGLTMIDVLNRLRQQEDRLLGEAKKAQEGSYRQDRSESDGHPDKD